MSHTFGNKIILSQNQLSDAAKWWMKAAEQKHEKATRALLQTQLDADVYYQIALLYEKGGEGIAQNQSRAFDFYIKTSDDGHKEASFWLGQ